MGSSRTSSLITISFAVAFHAQYSARQSTAPSREGDARADPGPASGIRCHCRRFGSVRRVGGEADERSRHARRAGLRRASAEGRRLPRARPAVRAEVPGARQRSHPAHAARAEGLLRLHRVQRRLVLQRHRRAVHHRAGQAVLVAGPHARHRRAHQRLGPPQLPLLAAGPEGLLLRRRRHRLAARLQGPRSRTTSWSRTTSASPAWSRTYPSCPTASSSRRCRSPASRTRSAAPSRRSSAAP